jgi:uncharacterized protein
MNKQQIIERLSPPRKVLQRLGVASLRLFGSAARGDASPESDADFLVRFQGTPNFDRFMDLKELLGATLGVRVDLVTEDGLRPAMRETVERDAVRVA